MSIFSNDGAVGTTLGGVTTEIEEAANLLRWSSALVNGPGSAVTDEEIVDELTDRGIDPTSEVIAAVRTEITAQAERGLPGKDGH